MPPSDSTTQDQPFALKHPFIFSGKVIDGEKVGRTIGFPTANLETEPKVEDLSLGVYLGTCQLPHSSEPIHYNCLVYFGPRYIFGEIKNNFEVYIYNFDQQIYGQELRVELTHFIRPPFDLKSIEELQSQLEQDKQSGLKLLQ